MRLDHLIDRLLDEIARERTLLRRITRYVLPLLLLPIGFALAQMTRSWVGLVVGGLGAAILLAQIELFLRPMLARGQVMQRDISYYLGLDSAPALNTPASAVPLLIPSALTLVASMTLFLPTILADARPWQRMLALALGMAALWAIWQRVVRVAALLDNLELRLKSARAGLPSPSSTTIAVPSTPHDGLLDPTIGRYIAGLPLPPLLLSPAAQALLRVEAYLIVRDFPGTTDQALRDALADLAQEAHQSELRHSLLPPVGGKLYLPIAAHGTLATLLGATARRFAMDGGYSASLGTWLLRLPPARSYSVAARLLDGIVALGITPAGAILPHHLTIQGDLGQESKVLSLVHLAATPLIFAERPGHATTDDRPFIMRGGGVLDDLGGRGRLTGPRTDFVDGFLFVHTPGMDAVEHITAHTINLRIKQVLAFGLLAAARPTDRRAPVERSAAALYTRVRAELRDLLTRYGVESALEVRWLEGRWSDVWPVLQRISMLKEHDPHFLTAAQQLRDTALDELESLAIKVTHARV